MNTSFSAHYVRSLATSSPLLSVSDAAPNSKKHSLQALVASTSQPLSSSDTRIALKSLQSIENDHSSALSVADADGEEYALKRAVIGRAVVALYAEALDIYMQEASDAETEAEWWADVGRSRQSVAYYFLQTIPLRAVNMGRVVVAALRTRHVPITLSTFTPASLRRLFPSDSALRPHTLTTALFPHLKTHPYTIARPLTSPEPRSAGEKAATSFVSWAQSAIGVVTLPYELTRHECRVKRTDLEALRDARAEVLGALTGMRGELAAALDAAPADTQMAGFQVDDRLAAFVDMLRRAASGQLMSPAATPSSSLPSLASAPQSLLASVQTLASDSLRAHRAQHASYLAARGLRRPARLTLLWPRLLLLPPLAVLLVRAAYRSRAGIAELARDTGETVENFFRDWLVEPLMDVVKTIRAGGEEGVIVRKEGVTADFNSLERMTLSLAKDKLKYNQTQLAALSAQIRLGDLTPILEIYEEDIKHPLQSAVSGTLLRSMFVQVQKAKVDIDQALAGIDKLLKSQELTFAFVGVAPAFAVVYGVGGYLRALWSGGRGRGRHGGSRRRAAVWAAMRRIERLLVYQPRAAHAHSPSSPPSASSPPASSPGTAPIPPLTSGLLLLSVAQLRAFAETCLPARSALKEGFLEDVADLEDPGLGRAEKLRVVDRMWKSWGEVFGWGRMHG
ncbi:NCA2-domain-containing protein [Athelia psychrophila]|uniref:NCA2-domain-containing protein n=1 Tax=Athelia psychrophila TaxID=1759441 RepID=A0A166UBU1_9AGAM|nr:NCA2-domain-containing protein [Fibularhizoctonia sp. CBS 109695]